VNKELLRKISDFETNQILRKIHNVAGEGEESGFFDHINKSAVKRTYQILDKADYGL
jgi:hypothetical protein